MANTKKSLFVATSEDLEAATDLLGVTTLTNAYVGVTYAGTAATDLIVLPEGTTEDDYVAAQAQQLTITTSTTGNDTVFSDGRTMHVTVIDVTDGRQVFPRRTFSGETYDELVTAIAGAELNPGDGRGLTCVLDAAAPADATGIVITAADDVVLKVAVNEDMDASISENSFSFHKGYTQEEAIEFAKNMATHIYGRTNRVGFPVVEPDFGALLTATGYSLVSFTKQTTRFDKNFGAGYIDQEIVYVLHDQNEIATWVVGA